MDKDVVHVYNGNNSAIKRDKIMPFEVTWKDLETVIWSDIIIQYHLYVESRKMVQMN